MEDVTLFFWVEGWELLPETSGFSNQVVDRRVQFSPAQPRNSNS